MSTYVPGIVAVLVIALLLGAFTVAVLRWGPRRGTWGQPAAALARPGSLLVGSMWVLAVVHVLLGIVVWTKVPGAGLDIVVVAALAGGFYVLCAYAYQLATTVELRMPGLTALAAGRRPRP